MSPAPAGSYRLTISPASTHLTGKSGGTYHGTVTVIDAGEPVRLTVTTEGLSPAGPKCTIPHAAPSWLQLDGGPSQHFVLYGGHDEVIPFTVHAPAGLADSAAVVVAAVPVHQVKAAARMNLSMGSRVTIGTNLACHAKPVAGPPPAHGGTSWALIAVLAVLAVALAVAIVIGWRKLRSGSV